MRRLLAIASLLILSLHQTQAQCTSYQDGFAQYAINLCPLTTDQTTPPAIQSANYWVPTSVDDGVSPLFTLDFSLLIYGVTYNSMYMSTNGALFFGTATTVAAYSRIPLSNTFGDYLPVIAPLWSDLYYVVGNSTIVYGTSGIVGSRTFIIRYANMSPYYTFSSNPDIQMSFDVIFYENQPGAFDIRYYRMDQVNAPYRLSIGLQSWDDAGVSWTLFTDANDWSTISRTIRGKQLNIRYNGTTTATESCGGLGYQFQSMRGIQLNFTDSAGVQWYYSPCGVVTNPTCVSNPATTHSMICQVDTTNTPTNLAIFAPRSAHWQYPVDGSITGVEALFQNGLFCGDIQADLFVIVAYVCDASATSPSLINATSEAPCEYRLTVRTNLACGGGSRGNDTDSIYHGSTLSSCNQLTGSAHTAALCPRPTSDLVPITLINQIPLLGQVEYGNEQVTLQWPFWFYGNTYTTVQVALNGALYFGDAAVTAVPTAPPSYGFWDPYSFPAIFAFGTSMSNLVYAGLNSPNMTYSNQVINGRRAFIVRYWNMKYTAYRGAHDMIISFDIILTEGTPGGIEIRYYTVTPNLNVQVSVGIHGPDSLDTYTGIVNYEYMSAQLANQLQGSTLNFTYVGLTTSNECFAFGINFTNVVTTDLVYYDSPNDVTYFLAPCGQLRSNVSGCRPGTSACQISGGTPYVLSSFNPSAITWVPSPAPLAGARAVLRDGAFCTATNEPRILLVDYVCSKLYPAAVLLEMTELSTCQYRAIILTSAVCTATVACSNVTSISYSGSLCPTVEPKFIQTSPVSVLSGLDDSAVRIRVPIELHFYGEIYRYIWIGTNGQLGFGPAAANSVSGSLPLDSGSLDQTPLVAAWMTDLNIIDESLIAYSTENINNQRVFVVRYQNIQHFGNSQAGVNESVSFDVLFFEGVSGQMEIRYYQVNQPSNPSIVTVGLQDDNTDPEDALIVANMVPIDVGIAASFTNSTLRITYSGPDVTTAPCGANGYNLTSLTGTDLIFVNGTSSYSLRICGIVSDAQCQGTETADQAMLCLKYNDTYSSITSLADWNPAETYWLYPATSTGVLMVSQNGPYCFDSGAPTVTVLNFVCSASATTPVITNIAQSAPCTYQADISTNAVCGRGARDVPVPPPQSSLTTCLTIPGLLYDAILCPRALNDTYVQPEPMINPTRILTSDDAYFTLEFGFQVSVYDRIETDVAVSSNGLLTFGYTPNSQGPPSSFPTMGLTDDNYPALAPFFSDLINVDTTGGSIPYSGFIAYSFAGTPPNRRVIIRYSNVDYWTTRNSIFEQSVSFDVILTEGNSSNIEIRYYAVDPAAQQSALVGIHGYGNIYTAVADVQPVTRTLAAQLSGSTLTYQFTGTSQPDVCAGVPGGYNLSSLSTRDLNYNTSDYQFWVRPCGFVAASVCTSQYATQRVSVCQATLNGDSTWALAANSPSSTVFSNPTPQTLRATISDGMLCPNDVPRQSIIDYTCLSTLSTTASYIDYFNENSTCVYYIRIMTSATCLDNKFDGVAASTTSARYNAELFYDAASMSSKLVQTSPQPLLVGSDDGSALFNISFPVRMYGIAYTQVQVSVNGWLSLNAGGPTGVPSQGMPLSSDFTNALPVLSVYMADLYNSNSNGTGGITWSVEGTTPNRYVLIRWNAVNYFATRPDAGVGDRLLSFDVKLYENSNNIDVLYWQTTTYTTPITIGLQATSTSYTVINNAQTIADRGLFMENYLLRYSYIDPMAPSSSSSSSTAGPRSSSTISSSAASSTGRASSSASASSVVSSSASRSSSANSPTAVSTATIQSSSASPLSSTAVGATSSSMTPITQSSSSGANGAAGSGSSSSSLSGGAIAGIVIGVVVGCLILLVLIAVFCFGFGRSGKSQRLEERHDEIEHDHESSHVSHNDDQGDIEMETV